VCEKTRLRSGKHRLRYYKSLYLFLLLEFFKFQRLEYRLVHFERDSTGQKMNPNREDFEVEKINLESAALFRQYGGIEVKLMILLNFSKFLIKLFTSNKRYSNEFY